MTYLIVKSIHIFVAVLWIGSLFLVAYLNSVAGMNAKQLVNATRITEAAIGLTWLFGVVLIFFGGWYASTWLYLKISLLVFISAIHVFSHRRWKREPPEQTHEYLAYAVAVASLLIVLLAVFKRPV